jgi:hypothetical protein
MVTRIAAWKHALDQIAREIDVLEKLVRPLPGKDKAAKDEQSQINQFGQVQTSACYIGDMEVWTWQFPNVPASWW